MSDIRPNADQFQELATSTKEGTLVMLNLLKFKRQADSDGGSGHQHTTATVMRPCE